MLAVYIILAIVTIIIITYLLNYKLITVSRYVIEDEKIPESFNGYKVLHLADWHCTKYGKNNKRLIKLIKKQEYDVIFVCVWRLCC